MRFAILFPVILFAGCKAEDRAVRRAPECPVSLVEKRNLEAKSSDIAVVGRWQPKESVLVPELGAAIGTIKVSKTIRGTLEPEAMVGIITGDISDPQGNLVQCGLTKPAPDEERIFYIWRGKQSLQVIDHRPESES